MTLDRDQTLDLLPLYAGGDLDPTERARVAEALERFPELRAELASFEALDGLLGRSLAPRESAAEPAWVAQATATLASRPLVRRHCPFCKDALESMARVLCASCLTPHHEVCFSENRGCSLLGCGGTRAIAADEAASKVCPTCSKHTPETAPFCAWCGSALAVGGDARPRHEVVRVAVPVAPSRRQEWARFAASVAVLLAGGLVVGWLFGNKQNVLLEQLWTSSVMRERERDAGRVPAALGLLAKAQAFYRDHRLGGSDRYAKSLDELDTALKNPEVWRAAAPAILGSTSPVPPPPSIRSRVESQLAGHAVEFHTLDGGPEPHFWLIVRTTCPPRERARFGPRPSFFVSHRGLQGPVPDVLTLTRGAEIPKAQRCPDCSPPKETHAPEKAK